MRRSVGFAARAHDAWKQAPGFRAGEVIMITLTYQRGEDWQPNDLRACLDRLRKWFAEFGHGTMRYVWVAELQKRGALHYHVCVWVPRGLRLPLVDVRGWWPHGASNTERAKRPVPYLLKYVSKGGKGAARLPDGARMCGSGGLAYEARRARRWLGLPGFVRARADIHDDWTRVRGGGWSDPDGVCIPSEYARAHRAGAWGAVRVADYGRPFLAAGPFSWLTRGVQ